METELIEVKEDQVVLHQDFETEELNYIRFREKKTGRFVIIVLSVLLAMSMLVNFGLAGRPAKLMYIRINTLHQAEVLTTDDTKLKVEPDDIKHYLNEWAEYRYNRQKSTIVKQFSNNYLFLESDYGSTIRREDERVHAVANILAGKSPETQIDIRDTSVTSLRWQQVGSLMVQTGTAQIVFVENFANNVYPPATMVVAIQFLVNPEQLTAQKLEDPTYARVNPLGITFTEFVENQSPTNLK